MVLNYCVRSAAAVVAALGLASVSAPTASAQQQQQDELLSTHDAWEIRCADPSRCYMTQTVFNGEGRPVLVMNIIKLASPQANDRGTIIAVADILTPLGVILPEGLRMQIDQGQTRVTQFDLCNPLGCLSRAPLPEPLVADFKNGGGATFLVSVPNAGGINENAVTVSLSGFTSAYDSLQGVNP